MVFPGTALKWCFLFFTVMNKEKIIKTVRTYLLPLAIVTGCIVYSAFHFLAFLSPLKPYVAVTLDKAIPWFIFTMWFVSFCKVEVKQMKPHRWHFYLIVLQTVICVACTFIIRSFPQAGFALPLEGFLVCVITPTAAAAAVIGGKLGGNESSLTSYMLMSNVLSAILIPLLFPLISDNGETFWHEFSIIVPRVFPMIVLPLFLGLFVRYFVRRLHHFIVNKCKDLAFYLWGITLVSVTGEALRCIVNSDESGFMLIMLAFSGLISCAVQFAVGKLVGHQEGQRVTAGQGFGQKNMVFGVWTAFTYLSPAAAISPGTYVLWQNIVNGFQMWYRTRWNENRAKEGLEPYQE